MATVRIQSEAERQKGIYFEYRPSDVPLGEGGMGKVFKGWLCNEYTGQRREVAIKFLYSDLPEHVIARARREAAVQLRNDNLIEMIGFVETWVKDALGQPAVRFHVISEYLHGVTLDKILEGKVTDPRGNVIPFAQELYGKYLNDPYNFAITIVRNILSGLMALHDAGYIHRDIDPSNIMVTSDGKIKLIDFGIAKRLNTHEKSYTQAGQFIGKPAYAAPELVRGLVDSQNVTTDIYAVGILLYQLLVGHLPFDGEMAEVLEMQLNKNLPLKEIKQNQIKEVIKKATRKNRSQRFLSAAEFRVAVEKLFALPYPQKSFNIKVIGISSAGVSALIGIIFLAINVSNRNVPTSKDLVSEFDKHSITNISSVDAQSREQKYQEALKFMSSPSSAVKGLKTLEELANNGDYKATFLLSRLYFDSPEKVIIGNFNDTIQAFRYNLGISAENKKAHALLKNAVTINSNDYKSLFELGCDYKSKRRGANFNTDSAYIYLNRARSLAIEAGDKEYENAINARMSNLKPVNR